MVSFSDVRNLYNTGKGVKGKIDKGKETFDKVGGKQALQEAFKSNESGDSKRSMAAGFGKSMAKTGARQAILFYVPPLRIPVWFYEGQDLKLRHDPDAPKSKLVLGFFAAAIRMFLRFFQELMALIVIGMYSVDLVKGAKDGKGRDPRWMYAVLLGTTSFVYAFVASLPMWRYWRFWFIDAGLLLMWLVCFGIFGKLYLPADPEENGRMRRACYIVAFTMVLWFLSAVHGGLGWWLWKRAANKNASGGASDEENLAQNGAPPAMTQTEPVGLHQYPAQSHH